jgi:hypothetical protein
MRKLLGLCPKTFHIHRNATGEWGFEYHNEEEIIFFKVSFHGAIALKEEFKKHGYKEVTRETHINAYKK